MSCTQHVGRSDLYVPASHLCDGGRIVRLCTHRPDAVSSFICTGIDVSFRPAVFCVFSGINAGWSSVRYAPPPTCSCADQWGVYPTVMYLSLPCLSRMTKTRGCTFNIADSLLPIATSQPLITLPHCFQALKFQLIMILLNVPSLTMSEILPALIVFAHRHSKICGCLKPEYPRSPQ
jgi:hypothetical protein